MTPHEQHNWSHKFAWFFRCKKCGCVKVVSDMGTITYYPHKTMAGPGKGTDVEPICKPNNNNHEQTNTA